MFVLAKILRISASMALHPSSSQKRAEFRSGLGECEKYHQIDSVIKCSGFFSLNLLFILVAARDTSSFRL